MTRRCTTHVADDKRMEFVGSWDEIFRVGIGTVVVYLFVISLVRIAGKRTASKMNNFDWIVTVALGSMVSTVILIPQIALIDGLVAITVLIALQYVITRLTTHSKRLNKLVRADPRLLYYEGNWMDTALDRERLTREEIMSAARSKGYSNMDDVLAVVFESSAELSIIQKGEHSTPILLDNVAEQAK